MEEPKQIKKPLTDIEADPRERFEKPVKSDMTGLNSHIHRGIDELAVPSKYPAFLVNMTWYDQERGLSQTISVNEEKLFTMTHLTKPEMVSAAAALTIAEVRGNRPLYLFTVRRMLGSLAEEGRGRKTIAEIIGTASQKISESVQMQRMKRVEVGQKGGGKEPEHRMKEEGQEEDEED